MGVKVKGGMWCPACERPVLGQKSTARFRNIALTALIPATGAASTLGYKNSGYSCPNCGSHVLNRKHVEAVQRALGQQSQVANTSVPDAPAPQQSPAVNIPPRESKQERRARLRATQKVTKRHRKSTGDLIAHNKRQGYTHSGPPQQASAKRVVLAGDKGTCGTCGWTGVVPQLGACPKCGYASTLTPA